LDNPIGAKVSPPKSPLKYTLDAQKPLFPFTLYARAMPEIALKVEMKTVCWLLGKESGITAL
jgi:hypothetical protein